MTVIWAKKALLPDGWSDGVRVDISHEGAILSVRSGQPPEGTRTGLLLPSPANIHSHAFQRTMAGLTERRGPDGRDNFWTWRKLMFRFLERLTPRHIEDITAFVQMEMLEAGYAASVEFHYLHHQPDGTPYGKLAEMSERVAAAATTSGAGLTLLPVLYQYGGCDRRPLGPGQVRFGNDFDRFARLVDEVQDTMRSLPADCRLGVAPHSLRAVADKDMAGVEQLLPAGPVHMHLAEQQEEVDEVLERYGTRPVTWFLDNCNAGPRWCLIHCTRMEKTETIRLAGSGAVAGVCPSTEANLGDGIFEAGPWFDHDGAIAIGSDSNIRISLAEELRALEYSQRLRDHARAVLSRSGHSTGRTLFEAISKGGAAAAGRNSGRIEEGALADLLALDMDSVCLAGLEGDTLLDSYIFAGDDGLVTDVWSAGRHLVREGHHVSRDEIVEKYRRTMSELRDAL